MLYLWYTNVPLAALHALTGLQQLFGLKLDLVHLDQLTAEELAPVLCMLCQEDSGITALGVVTNSTLLDVKECEQVVLAQVEQWDPEGYVELKIEELFGKVEEDEEGEGETEEGEEEEEEEGEEEMEEGGECYEIGGIPNLGAMTDSTQLDVGQCEELVLAPVEEWDPEAYVQLAIEELYGKGEEEEEGEGEGETEEEEEGKTEEEEGEAVDEVVGVEVVETEEEGEAVDEAREAGVGEGGVNSGFDVVYGGEASDDALSGDDVMMYFA